MFLVSLKAGGTGINLTSADIVIHFDPWWNPSIEERIIDLQDGKKQLINNVMSDGYAGANILSTLSNKELMDLFI